MIKLEEGLTDYADLHLLLETEIEHLPKVVYSLLNLFASLTILQGRDTTLTIQMDECHVRRIPDPGPARRLIGFFRLAALHTEHQCQGNKQEDWSYIHHRVVVVMVQLDDPTVQVGPYDGREGGK
jgi:hypothetical protein